MRSRFQFSGAVIFFSPELAKKMFDETGCDGIAVARGALGAPWIFKDIESYLKTGKRLEPKDILANPIFRNKTEHTYNNRNRKVIAKYQGTSPDLIKSQRDLIRRPFGQISLRKIWAKRKKHHDKAHKIC